MSKNFLPIILLGLLLAGSAALADGDIYAGGPLGTKITSLPYTISDSGTYYLTGNLSYSGTDYAITINSNDVTLDLMGYAITGAGAGIGIYMNGMSNVEVRNGTVTGFDMCIIENSGKGHRMINLRVKAVNYNGILLYGSGHSAKCCEASGSSGSCAICLDQAAIVSGCQATSPAEGSGVSVSSGLVTGNVIIGNGNSYGIEAFQRGSLVKDNEISGCNYGLSGSNGGMAFLGNTINTPSIPAYGIYLSSNSSTNLLDQNTILGPGTHYYGTSNAKARNNTP